MLPVVEQHVLAVERGAKCTQCVLYECHRGPVPSGVVPGCRIAISGEAPGSDEVDAHWNFVGWSGNKLDRCLDATGLHRSSTTIVNAVACQPPKNQSLEDFEKRSIRSLKHAADDDATLQATVACQSRFDRDMDEAVPLVYLAIGKAALDAMERYLRSRFLYDGSELVMARMHGAPVPLATPRVAYERAMAAGRPDIANVHALASTYHGADANRFLFGSYHPAFAAAGRSPKWMWTINMNLTRAMSVATRGWINWAEPNYVIAPPVETALRWLAWAKSTGWRVVTDLETCVSQLPPEKGAGRPSKDQHRCAIRTIGYGVKDPNVAVLSQAWHVLVLPFRHMDGSLWEYSDLDRARLADASRELFDAAEIDTHNGAPFDSEIMLRPTFSTLNVPTHLGGLRPLLSSRAHPIGDTRVLHHNTPAQDMPHTLSYGVRERYEVPEWKSKEDVTSTDNANDQNLLLRCGRDVYGTGLIADPLRDAIIAANTVAQNKTDESVALILRDMSELGLVVDEHERGKLSEILNRECEVLRKKWVELVGKDVNPRSFRQMQTLLFEDWNIEPPMNTDLDVYDPDKDEDAFESDEAATGVEAITMIMDRATEHGEFGNVSSNEEAKRRLEALETLLEFKALDKPRGSYADRVPVRPFPGPSIGRAPAQGALGEREALSIVHATWVIAVTPVGRSACKDPGLQQVPKLGRWIVLPDGTKYRINMRRQYVAAPGHVLVAADYEQSHVRIFYAVAQDEVGYDAIARGLKPHHLHAAALLADRPDLIMEQYKRLLTLPDEEQDYWKLVAKQFCFATIYNPRHLHVGSDIQAYNTTYRVMKKARDKGTGKRSFPYLKLQDCAVFEDRWYAGHPATEPWQRDALSRYEALGYAMSPILDMRKRYGPLDPTMIPNHEILAFEGSLKNQAMQGIAARIPHRGWSHMSGLVGDFHDSLMVQVPEDRGKEAAQIIEEEMTYHWRGMKFFAKAKIAKSWGAL